jgi:hypothetical protein
MEVTARATSGLDGRQYSWLVLPAAVTIRFLLFSTYYKSKRATKVESRVSPEEQVG